ncbi:Retrovirus-related Pol poly from transposon TNT 1-94 [Paramuricea clavata]|uniref:Retrovirus-related Pol poly from transposon TNT 1-94 n=1 Tax=Paramuricea clavata TaxID=317549 RepID=A0A7D9JIB1_PARCT|nr:Retrovirus-related Pol poly from transposon TNT 1-94 [Paramuricea clavata]
MLSHAHIPNEFWAEAVNTSVYVRNRSPTKALNGITPYECLFEKKPDVSNLRVFGCVTYVHIPDNQRKKLDAKSRKSIFMGYPEGVKGYKLYDPVSRKFLGSRDVIFLEKKFHDFDVQTSSNFDDRTDDDILIMIEETPVDANQNQDEIANHRVAENAEGNQQANDQRVGATFEETFMNKVRNVGERRMRRPPKRFDEECYLANDSRY